MHQTSHACRAKVRRLFQRERNQLYSNGRLLRAEQSRELDQSGDTTRVVVGARQWTSRIVVCTDDDSLR